jgi:alpha-tubulin suppressor-like RCC1 family protein
VTYVRLATGATTSYGITSTGLVYAWGQSAFGQVGNGLTATTLVPALVATDALGISATADNVVIEAQAPSS